MSADELQVYKAALLRDSQQMAEGVSNSLPEICSWCHFTLVANCVWCWSRPSMLAEPDINAAWQRVHRRQPWSPELVRLASFAISLETRAPNSTPWHTAGL